MMDNQTEEKNTNLPPVLAASAKKPFRAAKYIIICAVGIITAKGIFFLIEQKTAAVKQVAAKNAEPAVSAPIAKKENASPSLTTETKKIPLPRLTLNGIAASGVEGWALIDDRIVKAGDVIKGVKVLSIYRDRVELLYEGETFSLKVK